MIKTLSIPDWHKMAAEGNAPPVRIRLSGYSMNPLIRGCRDYVTVKPVEEEIVVGDIVLFFGPEKNRYVIHRVWELKEDKVLTWGDNCLKPDGWIMKENVWGKVVLIERGKRVIHPDPQKGKRWATFWHPLGRIYRFVRRIKQGILYRIRKMLGKKQQKV